MRFTIRDLLWLTVVVALGVAWWIDRGRLLQNVDLWKRREAVLERAAYDAGWTVKWDDAEATTGEMMHKESAEAQILPSD